jgi:hypothetical protein
MDGSMYTTNRVGNYDYTTRFPDLKMGTQTHVGSHTYSSGPLFDDDGDE